MLIVGQISNEEERREIKSVIELFIVEERVRYLARKKRKH